MSLVCCHAKTFNPQRFTNTFRSLTITVTVITNKVNQSACCVYVCIYKRQSVCYSNAKEWTPTSSLHVLAQINNCWTQLTAPKHYLRFTNPSLSIIQKLYSRSPCCPHGTFHERTWRRRQSSRHYSRHQHNNAISRLHPLHLKLHKSRSGYHSSSYTPSSKLLDLSRQ